ncbi:MAG TPA: dihydroorotase family protein [Actinomycetota bacterium]|nr:dihydroorotase family protein [Actinomycetota bacterium]
MTRARYDVVVLDGRLVGERRVVHGGIAISDGAIVRVLEPGERPHATRVIDARGLYVLPGVIDSHVHFRTPGLTHKEDWRHASRAAVAGGVTTVLDMPNTSPPLRDPDDVGSKAALVAPDALVDFGFYLGVAPDRVDLLDGADARRIAAVKVFMAGHHTAHDVVRDPRDLERIFAAAARNGLRLAFHAEDQNVLDAVQRDVPPPTSVAAYADAHPRSAALAAVARIVELARRYGVPCHVLHVSSAQEVDVLAGAAAEGVPVTFEVTGHHLSLTSDDFERLGTRAHIRPVVRAAADRDRLWDAVLSGEAASVGSDHAPHSAEEKAAPMPAAPPGMPGVQELLPTVTTGLARVRPELSLDDRMRVVARVLCAGPARVFGLARKGAIEPGRDADVVLFDARRKWTLARDDVHALCGWSTYEGAEMVGRVETTLRRGEVVYDDGRFAAAGGRWVHAPAHAPERRVASVA